MSKKIASNGWKGIPGWSQAEGDRALKEVMTLSPLFWEPLKKESLDCKILVLMKVLELKGEQITITKVQRRLRKMGKVENNYVKRRFEEWETFGLIESETRDKTRYWKFKKQHQTLKQINSGDSAENYVILYRNN